MVTEIRSGNIVLRNGQLYSEKNPTIRKILEDKIDRSKGVVIINNQGFSVSPNKQKEFIQDQINRRHGTINQVESIVIPGSNNVQANVQAVKEVSKFAKLINRLKPGTSLEQGIANLQRTRENLRNQLNQRDRADRLGQAFRQTATRTAPVLRPFLYPKQTKQTAQLVSATVISQTLKNLLALKQTPQTISEVIKNPRILKQIPSNLLKSGKEFVVLAKVSPTEAIAVAGTELLLLKGSGQALSGINKGIKLGVAKATGKYAGELRAGTNIKVVIKGTNKKRIITAKGIDKKLFVEKISKLARNKRTGLNLPSKNRKFVNIKVVNRIPTESLAKQISHAGKRRTLISSQANELVRFIGRKKTIMKPINLEKLSNLGKRLLTRFDKRKITRRQLIRLDKEIRKSGNKGILERSFFADPYARIRPSRFQIRREISTLGALKELKKKGIKGFIQTLQPKLKPQILIFPNQKISRLPRYLKSVENKLKKGISLTKNDTSKLLKWQQKRTGKFKPVGFLTKESEVTLAPGEIIKRVKKLTTVRYKGELIPIVQARVIKTTGKLKNLIIKAKKGKLNKFQLKKLNRTLKRKTGIDYNLSSYGKRTKVYYPIKRKFLSYGTSALSKIKGGYKTSKYTSKASYKPKYKPKYKNYPKSPGYKKPYKGKGYREPYYPGKPTLTYQRKPYKGKPYKTPYKPYPPRKIGKYRIPPKIPIIRIPKNFKSQRLSSSVKTYYVVEKIRGKFRKLYPKPLTMKDARDYATYSIDNHLSKTAFFIPMGKSRRVVRPSKHISGYFSRNSRKFRPYRIKYGKRKQLVNGFIEKRRYFNDTRGERGSLRSLNRNRNRKIAFIGKRIPRRKRFISASRRKQLIKQLKKARRIRMMRLRRRR